MHVSICVMEVAVRCLSLTVIEVFARRAGAEAYQLTYTIAWEITTDRDGFSGENGFEVNVCGMRELAE